MELLVDPKTYLPLTLDGDWLVNPYPAGATRFAMASPFSQAMWQGSTEYKAMYDRLAPGYDLGARLIVGLRQA